MPVPPAPEPKPELLLETHDGKSQFYVGERIQLDLVFRNTTSGPYMLNASVYGDLADKVEVAPTNGWTEWQGQSGHDYANIVDLGSPELRIPLVLNQGFVFREPGHYEIRVTTNRLSRGSGLLHMESCGPLTTNSVGIDLVPIEANAEAEQVKSLLAEIGATDVGTRSIYGARLEALSRLADLQGDDALRAKVRLVLAADEGFRQVRREALASTRNLPLQLSLLEAAWRNPATPPVYDMPDALQETRALLRGQTQPGFVMFGPPPDSGKAAQAAEEHKTDMEELLRSLPTRSGRNRADAAYYLVEDRSLPSADIAAAKPVALEEFAGMNDTDQHMLLETAWPAIRDASLASVLRAMLDRSPTDKDAIERLIDLDPAGSKDYVVQAVCDRRAVVPLDAVAALPETTLPEVDGCLGDLLRVPPAQPNDYSWMVRAELAARFASPAILPAVRQGWTDPAQDPTVLPLLLRYEPAEAISKIETSQLEGINLFYETNKVFKSREATFPPELTDWLRRQVQSGPEDKAGCAGYELSQGGAAQDRPLLEQRLARLRAEWASRSDDVASPAPGSPAYKARQLDVELMSDLRGSTIWNLSDDDAAQLALGCLSEQCRLYGKPRRGPQ